MNDLLPVHLSIIMIREKYTFLNTISEFKIQLYKYFKVDYQEEDIKASLYLLEEAYMVREAEVENQVIEYEEDY